MCARTMVRLTTLVTLAIVWPATVRGQTEPGAGSGAERIFYVRGDGQRSLDLLLAHGSQISILAPQAYGVGADGVVQGGVSPEVLSLARELDIPVMPLIHNPGFDQNSIHGLLDDPAARALTIRTMVEEAVKYGYVGWQFDFENIHVSYRDRHTQFYLEAAEALRPKGFLLSVAVVPTLGGTGETEFQRYMQGNWRESFDMPAMARIGDFISLMTYAQHGTVTPPGPIAGLPWMEATLEYALQQGVPPEKISLGIPTYSGFWRPGVDGDGNPRVFGREIHYSIASDWLRDEGAELYWDDTQGVHFAFRERSGVFEWLFLEDSRSLTEKLRLLDTYSGLRGISVWVLGAEDPETWDVLRDRFGG